jgi:hypothetical protein
MYKKKTRRSSRRRGVKKVSKKMQIIGTSIYAAELGGKRNRRK